MPSPSGLQQLPDQNTRGHRKGSEHASGDRCALASLVVLMVLRLLAVLQALGRTQPLLGDAMFRPVMAVSSAATHLIMPPMFVWSPIRTVTRNYGEIVEGSDSREAVINCTSPPDR